MLLVRVADQTSVRMHIRFDDSPVGVRVTVVDALALSFVRGEIRVMGTCVYVLCSWSWRTTVVV